MAVQATTIDRRKATAISWQNWLVSLLVLLLGVAMMLLAGFSLQPGARSAFTDQILGTLFSLPAPETLYVVGAFCLLVAGARLVRFLASVRSLLNWGLTR